MIFYSYMPQLTLLSVHGHDLATFEVSGPELYEIRDALNLALDYADNPDDFNRVRDTAPESCRLWLEDLQKNHTPGVLCFIEDGEDVWYMTDLEDLRVPVVKLDSNKLRNIPISSESS